jgi:hypothetical protein
LYAKAMFEKDWASAVEIGAWLLTQEDVGHEAKAQAEALLSEADISQVG